MIRITDGAATALRDALAREGIPARKSFRVTAAPGDDPWQSHRLTLTLDETRDDDVTVVWYTRTVLAFEPEVAAIVGDRTVDVKDKEDGSVLVLRSVDAE